MINCRILLKHLSIIALLSFYLTTNAQKGDTFRVFLLGGQSNMEGFGYNKDLPSDLKVNMKDVYIFDGNRGGDGFADAAKGKWEALRPGHGTGFTSDGNTNTPSDRFGLELAFAKRLKEKYPNDKIAIIKYARNGSSIDSLAKGDFGCWDPDYRAKPNQYDFFLATLNHAFASKDVNGDGKPDELVPAGILWMQGEGDSAFTEEIATKYYEHLKRLMDLMRAALRTDDLPVVIGKISDSMSNPEGKVWKYGELVQYAEEKYVRMDGHAAIVRSTSRYKYSDMFHYDSEGYLDLGKQFADAWISILK
ncbi:sialate O-acetylesterase [Flavobacterium silvaticum]|uniref:Sialate O-acetylesterase n=1 Tax=Flavobacterium silvaticum TaxID=1852020 RepID=A0A972FJC5_9FLAO|nr:sialate O-acetylesterase [Flavobacterium silvaticum]NMH26838.1 sialate O-acetylesterase [Flavobacterium silvaticum]